MADRSPSEQSSLTCTVLQGEQDGDVPGNADDHVREIAGDLSEIQTRSRTIGAASECDQAPDQEENQDRHDLPDFTEQTARDHCGSLLSPHPRLVRGRGRLKVSVARDL